MTFLKPQFSTKQEAPTSISGGSVHMYVQHFLWIRIWLETNRQIKVQADLQPVSFPIPEPENQAFHSTG